ncbi:MAG TPA: glycosyltransferase family 39 protein [Candidatus Limnocylindrales bacterium]|nr:glycosyltransferase family 39 protein [Candidatus Limnocylindrales bacterium]
MRIPLLLYALALGARMVLILLFPDPAYPDSYYYSEVTRSIAEGRGLSVDFVWIFAEVGGTIPAHPTLPIPSNAHWMPLASLVQVPFVWLLGMSPVAAALPFALIGSLAAPLAWAIARDARARGSVAVGAGILTALPALSLVFMPQPDNFSLFQPLAAGALWMAARGLRGDSRAFALGGLLVGLATLSRNDGVLVGAVFGLAFLWDRWRASRAGGTRRPAIPVASAAAFVAIFVVVMAPWWLRQLEVFGQLSPSTATGRVLYIRSIAEWNSITTPATLDWLLGQGIGPLVASRVGGLVAAIAIYTTIVGAGLLVPFMIVGGWARRRSVDFGPFFAYAGILFAFSAIVSAVHVPGGTFLHSAVALVPHSYILALEGIAIAVGSIASRRRSWNAGVATRLFISAAIAFAAGAALFASLSVHAGWDRKRDARAAVAAALDDAGAAADDRILSIDAAGIRYATGRGGVVTPNDPIETIESVARAYGTRWLILERDDIVPALAPVLLGQRRPAWIGAPVFERTTGSRPGATVAPEIALYPVCVAPGDGRCRTDQAAAP